MQNTTGSSHLQYVSDYFVKYDKTELKMNMVTISMPPIDKNYLLLLKPTDKQGLKLIDCSFTEELLSTTKSTVLDTQRKRKPDIHNFRGAKPKKGMKKCWQNMKQPPPAEGSKSSLLRTHM